MVTYPCRHSFWLTSLESFHFLHQISLFRCILCGCVRLARCWLVINRYHTVLTGVKKIRGRCETKDRSEAQERICLGSFTLYPICSFALDLPSHSLSFCVKPVFTSLLLFLSSFFPFTCSHIEFFSPHCIVSIFVAKRVELL